MIPWVGSAETLPQAVAKALNSNPRALAAIHAEQAALAEIDAARGQLVPLASLRGSSGPAFRDRSVEGISADGDWLYSDDLRLSIRQHVFDGKGRRNQVYAAEERALAAHLTHRQTQEEVALGVAGAYLNLLQAHDLIAVARANVEAHQAALEDASARAEAGDERADQALVRGRLGLAQSILQSREAAAKTAAVRYARFVGEVPSGALAQPAASNSLPNSVGEIDTSRNWAYQASEKIAQARLHDYEAAKSARLPRIELEANGGVGYDVQGIRGPDNESTFLVVGTWDVFDRSRNPVIAAAENRFEEGRLLADEERRLADELAGEAWAQWTAAREQQIALHSYQRQIDAVLRDYEEQFTVGKRSFLNVLDIRDEGFRAQSSLIEAGYREQLETYRYLAASGVLIESLGVEVEQGAAPVQPASLPNETQQIEQRQSKISEPEVVISESPATSGRDRLKGFGSRLRAKFKRRD